MISILVADDHAIVRAGLKQLLSETKDIQVTDEAVTGEEALQKLGDGRFQLLILDISMPGRGGMETLKAVRDQHPRLPVLMLSMHPEEQYAVRALKAGAAGYLAKDSIPEELIAAIRKVLAGGTYVSRELAEKLAFGLRSAAGVPSHQDLSDREYEVLRLIGRGRTPTEIAEALHLSVKTVSTYRSRILQKLQLSTTAELTRYAIREGLVD